MINPIKNQQELSEMLLVSTIRMEKWQVYDTIVRMAQDFSMNHILVDGQGNFGSIDGDTAAASRYTEIRMTEIAGELLKDIEKETCNF